MPSLRTQIQWCYETHQGLNQYGAECFDVSNEIDVMMRDLESTFFKELFIPIVEVYPHFQVSMQELSDDIITTELPYIGRQLELLMSTVQKLNLK